MGIKKQLKKLSKSTTAKIIASIIIPGGFIVWGVYELNKRIKSNGNEESKGKSNCNADLDPDVS